MRFKYPLTGATGRAIINSMLTADKFLVITALTPGRRIRIARLACGWRQIDLAAAAQVPVEAIISVEMDRAIKLWKRRRILEALGLEPIE